MDWKNVQPVIQVHSKTPVGNLLFEVPVRRGDNAYIGSDRLISADPLELLLLKHSQQGDLHFRAQLADLIQKNRSTVRRLEASDPLLQGPGESALLMSEQFARD